MRIQKGLKYIDLDDKIKVIISGIIKESCSISCDIYEGYFKSKVIKSGREFNACTKRVKKNCKSLKNNIRRL